MRVTIIHSDGSTGLSCYCLDQSQVDRFVLLFARCGWLVEVVA